MFDGYNNHFSAKKNAYTKRNPIRCQDVVSIIIISKYLEEDNEVAIQCDGNANPTVTSAAISLSSPKTDNPVIVVAHDTDIAVMLLHVF